MSLDTPAEERKLSHLLEEFCRLDGSAPKDELIARTRRQLFNVELVHGTNLKRLEQVLQAYSLDSRRQLCLGEDTKVYLSAGICYPDRQTALIISEAVESTVRAEATPFDSGAFWKGKIAPALTDPAQRRHLYERTCISAPQYRDFLVTLVANCYEHPDDWIYARSFAHRDILGILGSEWTSRVFEVRCEDRLPLTGVLLAVFLPGGATDHANMALCDMLEDFPGSPEVVYYDGIRESVKMVVANWIRFRAR